LPHDRVAHNNITGKRYIDHWREAGFECEPPIKNTGAGAAMMRVETARRIFPRCWFDEATTEASLSQERPKNVAKLTKGGAG
jgi:phage terminase large subunit